MRSRPSLLRRLLLALLPALLVLAFIGAAIDFQQMREVADDAYDQALGNLAVGLAASLENDRDDDMAAHLASLARALSGQRRGAEVQFAVQDARARLVGGRAELLALAQPGAPGILAFHDARLGGRALRVATLKHVGTSEHALIIVAEGLDARRGAARLALRNTLWANLTMVAAVLAVVTLGVRMALSPLHALGQRVLNHDAEGTALLGVETVPAEVRPLVDGMNRLIDRLRQSYRAQQAFLSASAHQLRTPLAGLQAQLDVVIDDARGAALRPALLSLRGAVQRLTRVTQQMLSLARAESGAQAVEREKELGEIDLIALLQEVLVEHLDAALASQVDLGMEATSARLTGERWMLRELLANLIDNALRYAPAGSQVTLRCGTEQDAHGQPCPYLEVEDAGPGIPAAQRERVFERFVRLCESDGVGSGLGLAIVREVAGAHRAEVELHEGAQHIGTRVRVRFPAPRTTALH